MLAAERVTLETDALGRLTSLPELPPNSRVEAIFLVLESSSPDGAVAMGLGTGKRKRQPHAGLAGQVVLLGDVLGSAESSDWNLPA